MMNQLRKKSWSPYSVGVLLGLLSWFTFLASDKALGVSTTFVRLTGGLAGLFNTELVTGNAYFAKYLEGKPVIEWQFALVVALAVGAYLSARLSGTLKAQLVPGVWSRSQGPSRMRRILFSVLGGFLLLFGARLAGGCTSGHGISGGLQLAVSGYVFMAAAFAAGIPVAFLLYSRKNS